MISERIRRRLSHYRLIGECVGEMVRTRQVLRWRPFEETARKLNRPLTTTPAPEEQERVVRRVRAALGAIRRRLPWSPTCLVRAVAAHQVLARRRVASKLVLSVTPASGKTVDAHAWLEAAGSVVTGRDEKARYVPIYTFSNASGKIFSNAASGNATCIDAVPRDAHEAKDGNKPAVSGEGAPPCSH